MGTGTEEALVAYRIKEDNELIISILKSKFQESDAQTCSIHVNSLPLLSSSLMFFFPGM